MVAVTEEAGGADAGTYDVVVAEGVVVAVVDASEGDS